MPARRSHNSHSGYKLGQSLKVRQLAIAYRLKPNEGSIFELMSDFQLVPYAEEDSRQLSGNEFTGLYDFVRFKRYSVFQKFPKINDEYGWKVIESSRDNLPALDVLENPAESATIINELLETSNRGAQGDKLSCSLRYFHAGVASPLPNRGFRFPIDMLRYDHCFPFNGADAKRIDSSISAKMPQNVPVRVVQAGDTAPLWTNERWNSYGWELQPVSYTQMLLEKNHGT